MALKLKFSLQRKIAFRKKGSVSNLKFHELLKQLWNDLIAEFIRLSKKKKIERNKNQNNLTPRLSLWLS